MRSVVLKMIENEFFTIRLDHLSDTCKFSFNLLLRSGGFCRIGKIVMKFLCIAGEIRTALFGIVTNSNHIIKIDVLYSKTLLDV